MNHTVVFYHDHCTDGFAAAYVVYKRYGHNGVAYIPCSYNDEPPLHSVYEGKRVIIVDFSFPLPVMQEMERRAEHITWLDHHKTAFEMLGKDVNEVFSVFDAGQDIILDNNRSGALIAFDWFFGRSAEGEAPTIIRHIDDRDRWQFAIPGSREFHASLQLLKPWSFEQWDQINASFIESEANYEAFIAKGAAALEVEQRQVTSAALKAYDCTIFFEDAQGGLQTAKGLAINSTVHMSEVGHELANASGTYGLIYYIDKDASVKCSLRSNGDYDVSAIAKFFGGGGHRNAAGFTTSFDVLKQFISE